MGLLELALTEYSSGLIVIEFILFGLIVINSFLVFSEEGLSVSVRAILGKILWFNLFCRNT